MLVIGPTTDAGEADQGPPGATGPSGPPGASVVGPTGPAGSVGPTGPAGSGGGTGGSLPGAELVGQVLYSVDGVTFEPRLPVTSKEGWLVNNAGILLVQ